MSSAFVAFGNTDYHALTSSCEEHTIGIEHIFLGLIVLFWCPLGFAVEFPEGPFTVIVTDVKSTGEPALRV